jgi:hypothetical protein
VTREPTSPLVDIDLLREIAETEFSDIVIETLVPGLNALRIILADNSFLDVWFSLKLANRYSYHWERRTIDGRIYRHDNAPHRRWQDIVTFPHHFHNGSEMEVTESHISQIPADALREMLEFVRANLSA